MIQSLFFKKYAVLRRKNKEKKRFGNIMYFQRDPPALAPSVIECLFFRVGRDVSEPKAIQTERYSSFAWRNLTQPN